MLRGGITCFNDMYFFPEAAREAAQLAGMRAALGMIVIEFPSAYASDPDDYLAKGLALRDRWREDPLLSFCLAPHAPYTVSDATFRKIATLAGEIEVPVHVHLHETEGEIAQSVAQHGVRPLERLRRLGRGQEHVGAVAVIGEQHRVASRRLFEAGQQIEQARGGAAVTYLGIHCLSRHRRSLETAADGGGD